MNTNTIPEREQTGVSALKAIEYMSPLIQNIIDQQSNDGAKEQFVTDIQSSFDSMEQDELMLLGHRLDSLHQITDILLVVVATKALSRLVKSRPVDPSLS